MKKIVFEALVNRARRSYGMRPIKTPFGIKKARVVFYNTMIGHNVSKDDAQAVMKTASIPLHAEKAVHGVIFAGSHLITTSIMRDALKTIKT